MKKLTAGILCALVSFSASVPVYAANVVQCGTDVCFAYDDGTLFGTGTVIGNNIFFLPTDFSAESLNGEGAVTTNETLNVQIYSTNENYAIQGVALQEQGDYKLIGNDSTVDVSGLLAVTSNTTLDPATAIPPLFPDGTQPYRIEELFSAGTLDTVGTLTQWDASALIDLGSAAGWGSDSDVTVTLENLLSATTFNLGDEAFVEKKFGGIGISVIPIPGAVFLFPSALVALAWFRRRRAIA